MKSKYVYLGIACLSLFIACNGNKKTPSIESLTNSISKLEKESIIDEETYSVDKELSIELLNLYDEYYKNFPTDSTTPRYLESAARLSYRLDSIDRMVYYYDQIIDNYPEYENLVECLFDKGLNLDNEGRKEEARKVYNEFLETFPDDYRAEYCRLNIQLLDIKDENLIEFLKNR